MLDLSAVLLFAGTLFVAAGTPGPSVAAMVSRVIMKGWRDVVPFVAAMWFGEALWMTVAVLGLSAIAETLTWLFTVIKYAGVAYLLYLAWQMWFANAAEQDTATLPGGTSKRSQAPGMFFAGLAVTLGNPKIILFYLALLPTLVDIAAIDFAGWLTLFAVTVVVLAIIDLSYMMLASKARHHLLSPKAQRIANRVSATAMGGAAVLIAAK